MNGQFKLTFNCKDRFNKEHQLEKITIVDTSLNKAVIDNIRTFQTEVNSLMTELVEVEKKEFPREQNNKKSKKDNEESEDESSSVSSVSDNEESIKNNESPDIKKLKTI
jgi:Sec-independent protein translocase protein TatA